MAHPPLPERIEKLIHDVIGAAIEVHKVLGLILNFNVPAMNTKDAIRRVLVG